jgi:hypothetical protein
VKARPSGEKRRKEMLRQERNRDKEEKRKVKRESGVKTFVPGDPDGPAEEPVAAGEPGSTQEHGDPAASGASSGRVSVP